MTDSYYLAVDVGSSRTAAAISRRSGTGAALTTSFPLGRSGDSTPSAIFVSDGGLLFGDAAERRGIAEPARLVREYKRRVGDDVPIIAGDRRFTAEEAVALTVEWVVDAVSEREGSLPVAVAVTVPAAWTDFRCSLIAGALARHGWSEALLVSEPEAAARHYEATSPLTAGAALAVYDLGGGTFDAVVLRKTADGSLRIAGAPSGLSGVGGADFDDALVRHTLRSADIPADRVAADPEERIALAALRRECVDAKEALSFDSEAVVPVLLNLRHGVVRVTRAEFEDMIESRVTRTADAFADVLEQAGIASAEITSILLAGGSSRIPRIAQVLSERFDRPLSIDVDPKAVVALGAARLLVERGRVGSEERDAADDRAVALLSEPVAASAAASTAPAAPPRRKWRIPTFSTLGGAAVVVAAGLVVSNAAVLGDPGARAAYSAPRYVSAGGATTSGAAYAAAGGFEAVSAPLAPPPPTQSTSPREATAPPAARGPLVDPFRAPISPAAPSPLAPTLPSPPTGTQPLASTPSSPATPPPVPEPTPTPDPEPTPDPTTPDPTPPAPEPPAPEPDPPTAEPTEPAAPEPEPAPADPSPDPAPAPGDPTP